MNRTYRFRSLALALLAGATMVGCVPGSAQAQFWNFGSWYGRPAPWVPMPAYPRALDEDRLRPGDVADLLRGYGWTLLAAPTLSGGRYVVTVRNAYGQRLYVVLDAYEGTVLRSRLLDDQPDTSRLAAIPNPGTPAAPDDRYLGSSPGRAAKATRRPQAKRISPPASVKRAPPPAPAVEDGAVAVAKPATPPPAVRPLSPTPAAKTAPSEPASGPEPVVRQVYPASGDAPSAAAPPAPAKPTLPADAGFE